MKHFLFPFLFFFIVSCVEQKKTIEVGRYQESLSSCRETVFIGNISSKKNILNLMKCLRWNQELPTLFNTIESVSEEDWNFLTTPIDQEFFYKDASANRDKLFSFLYQSNANGQLKRIDTYLKKMSIRNVATILKLFLDCEKNCDNKLYSKLIPDGITLKKIISSLSEFYQVANNDGLIDRLYQNREAILSDKSFHYFLENININFSKILKHPFYFQFLRQSIIGITHGNISDLKIFLNDFSDKENYKLWLDEFFINAPHLLRYTHLAGINNGTLVCEQQFSINLNSKINSLVKNISDNKYSLFVGFLLNDFSLLTFGDQVCHNLSFEKNEFNFIEFIKDGYQVKKYENSRSLKMLPSDIGKLVRNPNLFKLIQNVLLKGNYSSENIDQLLDFSKNDIFITLFSYLEYLKKTNNSFYDDFLSIPYFLSNGNIIQIHDFFQYLQQNPEIEQHLAFVFKNISRSEIIAIVEELSKVLFSFEEPKNLIEFLVDISSLSESLINRYKVAIYEDKNSVSKLNRLYGHFISASDVVNFEKEFSLILSSRYIIKAARLIGRGVVDSNPNVENLFEISKIDKIKEVKQNNKIPKLILKPDAGYDCLDLLSKNDNFVEVISEINKKCTEIISQDNLFGLLQDISTGFTNYNRFRSNFSSTSRNSIYSPMFNEDGLFGEAIVKSSVISFKRYFDQHSNSDSKNLSGFVKYLIKILNKEDGKFGDVLIRLINLASSMIDKKSDGILRNFQLASILEAIPQNGNAFNKSLKIFLLKLKANLLKAPVSENISREGFKCENFFSSFVGHNRCQNKEEIKNRIKNILFFLTRKNGESRPTALRLLTEAVSPEKKYEIKFYDETIRYQLTLEETANLIVNVHDLDFKYNDELINQRLIRFYFVDSKGKKYNQEFRLTTGDRLEAVVREVRFDGNYLGVHYMNSVVASPTYVETIQKKYSMLKTCGIYLRYCLHTFTKEEYAMLRNGVNSYPSLWETETIFGKGKYLKTLLHVLVDSSSQKAAKATTVKVGKVEMPYMQSESELKEHNGRILTEITYLSGITNLYRVLMRSFGSNEEFRKYIKTDKFKYISKNIFSKIEPIYFENLINNLIKSVSADQYLLLDTIIDRIYLMDDFHMKKIESIIHNFFYLLAYLPEKSMENEYKYIFDLIDSALADKNISKFLIDEKNLKNVIEIIEPILDFLVHELLEDKDIIFSNLLKEIIQSLQKFDNNLKMIDDSSLIKFLSNYLNNQINTKEFEGILSSMANLFGGSKDTKELLIEGIDGLVDFIDKTESSFEKFYNLFFANIYFSTIKMNCVENNCANNEQFDELFKILSFLANKEDGITSNISYLIDYLRNEKINFTTNELTEFIDSVEILE